MCTHLLHQPIVFLHVCCSFCVHCSALILLIKTVRCSIVCCCIPICNLLTHEGKWQSQQKYLQEVSWWGQSVTESSWGVSHFKCVGLFEREYSLGWWMCTCAGVGEMVIENSLFQSGWLITCAKKFILILFSHSSLRFPSGWIFQIEAFSALATCPV